MGKVRGLAGSLILQNLIINRLGTQALGLTYLYMKKIPVIEHDGYAKDGERYEVGFKTSSSHSIFLPAATIEELMDLRDAINARIETELLKVELKQINVNTNENLS